MAHRDRHTSDNEGKGLSLSHLIETTWESTSPTLNRNAEVSQKERVGGITQPWNTIMQHCNEANVSMQSQFLHVLATLEFIRQPAPHSYIMHTYNYKLYGCQSTLGCPKPLVSSLLRWHRGVWIPHPMTSASASPSTGSGDVWGPGPYELLQTPCRQRSQRLPWCQSLRSLARGHLLRSVEGAKALASYISKQNTHTHININK